MTRKDIRKNFREYVATLGLTLHEKGDTATMSCNTCGATWPVRSERATALAPPRTSYCLCPKGCNKELWERDNYGFSYSDTIKESLTPEQRDHYFMTAFWEYLNVAPGPCETMLWVEDVAMVVWWDDQVVHFFLGTTEEAKEEAAGRLDAEVPFAEITTSRMRLVTRDGVVVKGINLHNQIRQADESFASELGGEA